MNSNKQAQIIDGKAYSNQTLEEIKNKIEALRSQHKRIPGLAVVLVGNDPASEIYVTNKQKACDKVGIKSYKHKLSSDITEGELLSLIQKLNHDNNIDGILVQLPLPKHLNSKLIIDNISPDKDVDGFHRYNIGSLALNDATISPCTPHGIIQLLDSIGFSYPSKHAVVIGASNIVGRPMALELLNKGATVTICNSRTRDLKQFTLVADLVVVAVGKPKMLTADMVNTHAIIIDVGINRDAEGKLCGDADFDSLVSKVDYITPVPGGVGPMTIAMLIVNTVNNYFKN